MYKQSVRQYIVPTILRLAGLTLIAATATLAAQERQTAITTRPTIDILATLKAPVTLYNHDDLSYSSSTGATEAAAAERLNLSSSADASTELSNQPPPRRRYGRPNYHDSRTNPDGSSKYTFVVGGGFTVPTANTGHYLKPSYSFQVGGGRNFSKQLALIAQFDWDNFGIQSASLSKLLTIYNNEINAFNAANPTRPVALLTQLGGGTHVWSFSVNPTFMFAGNGNTGAYFVVGAGFYHKATNITVPTTAVACDYYGCYQYAANQSIDKYTSNAPGFSGGLGFTYKPSRYGSQRFFAEARYVWIDNQQRPFSEGTSTSNYYNVFPQNSSRTGYIPVKVGLRF